MSDTGAPKTKPLVARFDGAADPERAKASSDLLLRPTSGAAAVAVEYLRPTFGEQDMVSLVATLTEQTEKIKANDLSDCEALLFGQAQALNTMFVTLARRAIKQEGLAQYDAHMRMAVRAQNQSRMTLETLATIKNPPVVIAKQANFAAGHQQVNNGSRAGEIESKQPKLLEAVDGERLDTGAKGTAGKAHPQLATVGAVNRTKVRRGKGQGIAERLQGRNASHAARTSKSAAGD